jgi:hypothetical protein
MRQIHQTLLSEKELYQAIVDYLHTHGIPEADIDDVYILLEKRGARPERVVPNAAADMVSIYYRVKT